MFTVDRFVEDVSADIFPLCVGWLVCRWSWKGKELVQEGKHRSKRGAKNEAARSMLKQLAADEANSQ